jgi:hypothetical protein
MRRRDDSTITGGEVLARMFGSLRRQVERVLNAPPMIGRHDERLYTASVRADALLVTLRAAHTSARYYSSAKRCVRALRRACWYDLVDESFAQLSGIQPADVRAQDASAARRTRMKRLARARGNLSAGMELIERRVVLPDRYSAWGDVYEASWRAQQRRLDVMLSRIDEADHDVATRFLLVSRMHALAYALRADEAWAERWRAWSELIRPVRTDAVLRAHEDITQWMEAGRRAVLEEINAQRAQCRVVIAKWRRG